MPSVLSECVATADSDAGAKNDGQPEPESNFDAVLVSKRAHTAQTVAACAGVSHATAQTNQSAEAAKPSKQYAYSSKARNT
jgi:hypothetical protein